MRQSVLLTFFLLFLSSLIVQNDLQAQTEDEPNLCDTISPYNPDANCNGLIDISDALEFFNLFATSFTPDTAIGVLENLDPDPTNELQWLAIDGDTLRLLMPDSSVYSSVFIGGADGEDGLSAYEIWQNNGNSGSESDFLASLVGEDGAAGTDGSDGDDGTNGLDGMNGADGLSAYEIWLAAGNSGDDADFLASLIGADGANGSQGIPGEQGETGPIGPQGETGADGESGLSAYQIWLGLGNTGTEEDFIEYLSSGEAFSPSSHGVFDSETNGTTFTIAEAIATVSVELWGASGGSGGDICGQTVGAVSCNLCDATGGVGGRALKMVSMVYNLAQGDVLELLPAGAGADSGELITCNPGLTGWTNWDCGPASNGTDGGMTQLLLNGEVIAEISGGIGGSGACIGCQGDGCFNGDGGADGALTDAAIWMTILSTEALEGNTGSRVILRY